jgi:prepilin-type N-terminal cleavage/methylation domain-containing protein
MKNRGFTLVELLIVFGIIAALVVVAVPVISSINIKAGLSADKIQAEEIETCIYDWMSHDFYSENFFRSNLLTSSSGVIRDVRINGYTEQLYSYYYAGTSQLPGVECSNESEIRHAVITAIKSVSNMELVIKDGEQFVEPPDAGAQYGFKYYYKIGRVNTERIDSTASALGNDTVYQYYVWLDRTGGNVDSTTIPKHYKDFDNFYVSAESMRSFQFTFGAVSVENIRVVIEQSGEQSYTFDAVTQTPAMFKNGTYIIRCYYNGELKKTVTVNAFSGAVEHIDLR